MNKSSGIILIVDDTLVNIELLGNLLMQNDYEVITASSGKETLEILNEELLPELILLDIMMPEMDGFEVCKIIKTNPRISSIPIIFLTAKIANEDIVKGFKVGAVDYITKPFQSAELFLRIETHLKIKRLQVELEVTNQKLSESIRTKDKFFSLISHDLKGPIGSILGLLEMVKDESELFDLDSLKTIFINTYNSVDKLNKLLINLLDWATLQTNKMVCQPVNLNLMEVTSNTIEILLSIAKNKNIEILVLNDGDFNVHADRNMVETIIRNLISNAIKFTRRGGKISISFQKVDKYIYVAIQDSGIGMNEDKIKNLFRVDVKSIGIGTEKEKGTGLGLILCKELVELNNGKIWVKSEMEKGSIFTFSLLNSNLA